MPDPDPTDRPPETVPMLMVPVELLDRVFKNHEVMQRLMAREVEKGVINPDDPGIAASLARLDKTTADLQDCLNRE
jgi:hypothetical protein